MVNVGTGEPRHGALDVLAAGQPFITAFTGVLNIILSYSGHVAYFSLASELKDPRDFKKALFLQMGIASVLYTLVGVSGPGWSRPASSTTSTLLTPCKG